MPAFDWTINLGHVLTLGGFFLGGMSLMFTIREDVRSMKASEGQNSVRLDNLERDMKVLADATLAIARQDERMNGFEHRLTALELEFRTLRASLPHN